FYAPNQGTARRAARQQPIRRAESAEPAQPGLSALCRGQMLYRTPAGQAHGQSAQGIRPPHAQPRTPRHPAARQQIQAAACRERAQLVEAKGKKVVYTKRWDLSDLPSYEPKQKVSGTIRMWGSNYIVDGNVGKYCEEGFRKFHPGVKFDYHMKTTIAAVPALVF